MTSIRSVWAATPPEIDGVALRDEWADGGLLKLPHTKVFFKNDAENLYILLDVIDDTIEDEYPGDYLWIIVDVDRSKNISPGTDVTFQILGGGRGFRKAYWLEPSSGSTEEWIDTVSDCAKQFRTSFNSATPHRVLEFALNLEEIGADPTTWWGLADQPPVVRIGLRIHSLRPPFTDEIPSGIDARMSFADLLEISLATQPDFPAADIGPVFFGVGFIPYGRIDWDTGHATTEDDAPLPVKNAAFGRRLDVLGNIRKLWHGYEVSRYRIWYRKDGGGEQVLRQTWSNYKRERVAGEWEDVLYSIGPDAGGIYDLPNPDDDWLTANLLLRWQTRGFGGGNGLYTVRLEPLTVDGEPVELDVSEEDQLLRLAIDNTWPEVDILEMKHVVGDVEEVVERCAIVKQGTGGFRFHIEVNDPEGHLLRYRLTAYHGDPGDPADPIPDGSKTYDPAPTVHGPSWTGVDEQVPYGGAVWTATESCAHEFRLRADARIINGYGWVYQGVWCSKYVTILVG